MPKLQIVDPDDPYYIPSVPMYLERFDLDNDNAVVDDFFKRGEQEQTLTNENISPTRVGPPVNKAGLQLRRSLRRSQQVGEPPQVQKPALDNNKANKPPVQQELKSQKLPFRRSVFQPPQPPKQVVKPKTEAKKEDNTGTEQRVLLPRRPLRRSQQFGVEPKVPNAEVPKAALDNNNAHPPAPQQLATKPKVETKKEDNTGIGTVQGPLLRHPLRRPSILSAGTPSTSAAASNNNKPTIIQPPMRFGNNYSTRRSVLPPASPVTVRGKAAGISHGVRGISIHQTTHRD